MTFQEALKIELEAIEVTLIQKNIRYGNSALKPLRIFSKASTDEQIKVRIDDKLSRIANGIKDDGEDTELDLIGYLIIKRIQRRINE